MNADELPYTLSSAILYRLRIDSFNDLPKEKRPPRNLWDKPHQLEDYLDEVFSSSNTNKTKTEFIEFDPDEVE